MIEILWTLVLTVLAFAVCALIVGLTAMAVTGCIGQVAENLQWIQNKWRF